MLADFASWWTAQMRSLLPAPLRTAGLPRRRSLVATVAPDGRQIDLALRTGTTETRLGPLANTGIAPRNRRTRLSLRVPPAMVLERSLVLPLAAEADLTRIIAYEMDRQTPFRAEDVIWTCRVEQRDTVRRQLHIHLAVLPRVPIQPALDALKRAGRSPASIETDAAPASRITLKLLPAAAPGALSGRRAERLALACCALLASAAIATPFAHQSLAFARIDARIDAVRPQVAVAEKLRARLRAGAAAADALATARNQLGLALEALTVLTEVLPDDTYLTTLSAHQRAFTFNGRSAAAARSLGAMAAHPLIRNPVFTGPVVRDEVNGGETFSIRAEIGH